jgi:hypothetical protein
MMNEIENNTSADAMNTSDALQIQEPVQNEATDTLTTENEVVSVVAVSEAEETAQPEFSTFDKTQILEFADGLIKNVHEKHNFKQADLLFKALRERIDFLFNEEREAALEKFKNDPENAEKSEDGFEFKKDEQTLKFDDAFRSLRRIRDEHFRKQEEDKSSNLKTKRRIIEDIKNLFDAAESSEKQSSLRTDFEAIKKLQEEWKNAGPVPQGDLEDLNKSYKATLDRFYAQKKLEKDLLELGLNRNLEAKLEICEKAEALIGSENLNEAVKSLNDLHKKFKQIGGVPRERHDEVWDRFKIASDKIYDKKRSYSDDFKKQLEDNMKIKQELCLKVEAFIDFTSDRIKQWNEKTKEILEIQTLWEAVGAAPKEVSKGLNKHFWKNFKAFFENKNKFFEAIESERKTNLAAKEALCVSAETLKESSDWDAATESFKVLQEDWKKVGPVPDNVRDTIYERFKAACDAFFERKRNRRNTQDKDFEDNFDKKEAISKEIEAITTADAPSLETLEALVVKWNAIGFVPKKNMTNAQDRFADAVDACMEKLQLPNEQKTTFREKHNLRISNRAFKTTKKKETNSSKRLSILENDINLWENNIAFFARSKNADALRQEYDTKIRAAQAEIVELRKQMSEGN